LKSVAVVKALALSLVLVVTVVTSSAQGIIVYYNRVAASVVAPVYGVPTEPGPNLPGNTSAGFPAGTRTYSGPLLTGTGYYAGLWAGPVGATIEQLTFVPGSLKTFRTGNFAGAINNSGNVIAIPGVVEGSPAVLQLRAWDNQGGTITSYDDADIRGASLPFTSGNLGGVVPPPTMAGLQSFQLIPEPATYALITLGAASMWLFRRRK
jgi:hypothetical protein